MSDERLEHLPEQVIDDPDAIDIIAERLWIKGAVTLHDIAVRLKRQHEKRLNHP